LDASIVELVEAVPVDELLGGADKSCDWAEDAKRATKKIVVRERADNLLRMEGNLRLLVQRDYFMTCFLT
jgi:hypothetical protein